MVTIRFGPAPDFSVDAICNYVAIKNGITDLLSEGWDNTKREIDDFGINGGNYIVRGWDGVGVTVERNREPYLPGDGSIVFGVSVVVEADTIDTVNRFVETAREFIQSGRDNMDFEKGVPLDSVVLPGDTKESIVQDLERFLSTEVMELHRSLNIPHTRGRERPH